MESKVGSANSCKEMKINDWDAALYKFDKLSHLCCTDTSEASYVLKYNPDVIQDQETLKIDARAKKHQTKRIKQKLVWKYDEIIKN